MSRIGQGPTKKYNVDEKKYGGYYYYYYYYYERCPPFGQASSTLCPNSE